jgi:hypothetical protein
MLKLATASIKYKENMAAIQRYVQVKNVRNASTRKSMLCNTKARLTTQKLEKAST